MKFLSRNFESPGEDPAAQEVAERHQYYCAPKVIKKKPTGLRKVDVWDADVAFYNTFLVDMPFHGVFKAMDANKVKSAIKTQLATHM